MSSPVCKVCQDKGWRWARSARSLGQKGMFTKKPCTCAKGKAWAKRHA